MGGRVGVVTGGVAEAARLGLAMARRGAAVRIFPAATEPGRVAEAIRSGRTDLVILAADDPAWPEAADGAELERLRLLLSGLCDRVVPALEGLDSLDSLDSLGVAPGGALEPLAGVARSGELGVLAIAGADSSLARAQTEAAAEAGALLLTMTREAVLDSNETFLMGLSAGAATALKQGRDAVIRSENWTGASEVTRRLGAKRGIPGWEVERRVRTLLARAALQVMNGTGASCLIAMGGETAGAAVRALGLAELIPAPEVPGETAWLVGTGEHPVLLGLRHGPTGGEQGLVDALAEARRLVRV